MGRRPELRDLSDRDVRDWMAPRRAHWQVALENNGIDGGVGAIVRAHNAFAGGGVQLLGRGRYNKRAAVGTHQHEPIRVLDTVEGVLVVGVEADPALAPLPARLWPEATYVLGHDGVGLSPALAARCDARFGPPPGWGAATSPAMLAHLLMWRLRQGPAGEAGVFPNRPHRPIGEHTAADRPVPEEHTAADRPVPEEHTAADRPVPEEWAALSRREQRVRLPFDWWVRRFAWDVRRDWWVHLPDGRTPLNAVVAARNALAAGAAGIVTPDDPGPERAPLGEHWRVRGFDETVARARADGRAVVALEQGGTPLAGTALPARAVLVAGHEVRGLSPTQLRACDSVVTLPQWGSVNSYNVASAVGLVLDAAPLLGERG